MKQAMDTTAFSSDKRVDVNVYWDLLKDLSADTKLDLIARLSNSLFGKNKVADNHHWASEFAGKWEDDRPAEEIVDDIRKSRTGNREIEL